MATNISNKNERNQLNLTIRQQPWYEEWFRSKGLDPNKVQLSKQQKQELQQLVVSKGFLDPSDGHIDEAGNVSDFHGWKGLPTAAKVAIGLSAAVATGGAGGMFTGAPGAFGIGGASTGIGAGGLGSGLNAAAAGNAAHVAGGGMMLGGKAVAAAPGMLATMASKLSNPLTQQMIGKGLSKFSENQTQQRQNEVNNRLTYDQLAMAANSRANRQRMIADSSLTRQLAPPVSAFGRTFEVPRYGPQQTEQSRAGDEEMRRQAMIQIMQGSGKPALTEYDELPTKPGLLERMSGYLGTGLDIYGGTRGSR